MFVGIDGKPGGWVAVYLDRDRRWFDHAPQVASLLRVDYERAMIDIPIGLPERGYRACDLVARKLAGPRVFLGARRDVWTFDSYQRANEYYQESADKRISLQLWCIREKLKEVNELITPELQTRLMETHPELVFWRLNEHLQLANKKTEAGRERRLALLRREGLAEIEGWLSRRRGTGIG